MYIQSPYPAPPPIPEVNTHYLYFRRPDQAAWPDYTLYIDASTGERIRFSEFKQRVQDLATTLGAPTSQGGLGIQAGDGEMVGIISENCVDYITLIHSCLTITTPFALIPAYATPFELRHAFTVTKVTRLFTDAKLLPVLLPIAKEFNIPPDRIHLILGHAPNFRTISDLVHDTRIKNIPSIEPRPAKNDTLAYLVFSSGTSGPPKAVMISHGNLNYAFSQSVVMMKTALEVYTPPPPPTPEGLPVTLAFLPLHHTYGLHAYGFRSFLGPSTFVLLRKWDIKTALDAIPKFKVTNLPLIPSVAHQLANQPDIHKANFGSIQSMASGAAYLPPELADKMAALLPKDSNVVEGYGLSEVTIAALAQPFPGILGGKMKRITGSAGILLPGMEARLTRDDGSSAGPNESAELWLKGQNVALGYWKNEKANQEAFVDGWLRTGDKFRIDEEGYFFYADRAKDTLKISGIQVSPVEIENILLEHPKKLITDVTVAGVSGHGRTSDEKVPRAWIVLSPKGQKLGAKAVIKELDQWHKKNLSKYKWLRGGIEVVNEIPKSPTGKTLRRILQEQYESRHSRTKSRL